MRSRIHLRLCAGALVLSLPVIATSSNTVGGTQVSGVLSAGTSAPSTSVFGGSWATPAAEGLGGADLRHVTKHVRTTGRHNLREASPTPPDRLEGISVDDLDIPGTALVAYQVAAATMAQADPSCKVDWALLAAIGRVESDHGRYGGARLSPSGIARPAIRGVALNGKGPVAAVPDTDGGRLDGDKVWDRAVGPMQFLPSTWSYAGVDADGDGVRSPDDINDAALAAAVYLCAAPGTLDNASGVRTAVHRYNASSAYVDLVVRLTQAYRHGDVAGLSSGTTLALGSTQVGSPWTGDGSTGPSSHPARDGSATGDGRHHLDGGGGDGTGGTGRGSAHTEDPVQALPDTGTQDPLPGPDDGHQSPDPTETPTPTPTPSPEDPTPSPDPEPTHEPDPTPHPSTEPSPDPSTDPTPSPEPQPELVALSGTLTMSDDDVDGDGVKDPQWYLAGVALDLGDATWLASDALADLDGDGAVESNATELSGLVDQAVDLDVEPDTSPAVVHTVNGLAYRED